MPIAEVTHDISAIQDEVTAKYFSDMANLPPDKGRQEATIARTGRYMFRTRAGTTEQVSVILPTLTPKQLLDDKLGEVWKRRYERKYGVQGASAYEDLKERVGSHRIKFTRIHPGQFKGCYYGTDDEAIADFLRAIVKGGTINGMYEDFKESAKLRSQYTDTLFENTEAGRQQLAEHDLKIERAVREAEKLTARTVAPPVAEPIVAEISPLEMSEAPVVTSSTGATKPKSPARRPASSTTRRAPRSK